MTSILSLSLLESQKTRIFYICSVCDDFAIKNTGTKQPVDLIDTRRRFDTKISFSFKKHQNTKSKAPLIIFFLNTLVSRYEFLLLKVGPRLQAWKQSSRYDECYMNIILPL